MCSVTAEFAFWRSPLTEGTMDRGCVWLLLAPLPEALVSSELFVETPARIWAWGRAAANPHSNAHIPEILKTKHAIESYHQSRSRSHTLNFTPNILKRGDQTEFASQSHYPVLTRPMIFSKTLKTGESHNESMRSYSGGFFGIELCNCSCCRLSGAQGGRF